MSQLVFAPKPEQIERAHLQRFLREVAQEGPMKLAAIL